MSKNKHSKFRNTGLMFEFMTRKITDDILHEKESKVTPILQRYFSGNSELSKEYNLYRTLSDTTSTSETKAQILIDNIVELSNKLDRGKLDRERYNLVKELKECIDIKDLFSTKIPNYKLLASINTIMENGYSDEESASHIYYILDHLTTSKPKENEIINSFLNKPYEQRLKILDLFIERFNSRFSNLSYDQKNILVEYITNSSNPKHILSYIKGRTTSIREDISYIKNRHNSDVMTIKLEEVFSILNEIDNIDKLQSNHIATMLYIYELVNTLKVQ